MLKVGTFTHIYHPNNENLFDNASIDVIVFRYYNWHIEDNQHIIVGQKRQKKTLYNNDVKYLINTTFQPKQDSFIDLSKTITNILQ